MITEADLRNLSQATLDLYSPQLHAGNFIDHAFRFLHAVLPVDQVNYGNLDPRAGQLDVATSVRTPHWDDAVAGFGRFMAKYPYFCFDPSVNGGRPFFRNDFITVRQFRDLDIFSECFRILDAQNHAAVHVPTNDGRLLWFGIERADAVDYTERDRLVLTLAQDHLTNAYRLAGSRAKLRAEIPLENGAFCRAGLTPREADVAHWLTEGKTNSEIAALLHLQLQTVKSHVTTLFNKTGTGNRLALTLHLLELARTLVAGSTPLQQVPVHAH
jgi:DNA-binding CsgD family transcriptional regulator